MPLQVYSSVDVDNPVGGFYGAAGGQQLIDALTACLVDGYGTKAGSGWTKPFSDGLGKAVFRAPAGTRFYLFVDETIESDEAYFRGYQAMTALETGTDPFPSLAQVSALNGGVKVFKDSSTSGTDPEPWRLYATDKAFLFVINHHGTDANIFYFGDFTSYLPGDTKNAILTGAEPGDSYTAAYGGGLLRHSHEAVDLSIADSFVAAGYLGAAPAPVQSATPPGDDGSLAGNAHMMPYPDPITGGIVMDIFRIMENPQIFRGEMPGFYNPLQDLTTIHGETVSGTGSFEGHDFRIEQTDADKCIIVSLHPDDWA